MTLEFNDITHTYTYAGVVVPSVTQVLKANRLFDTTFMTDEGRDRGTDVATLTAVCDRGDLSDATRIPESYVGYLDAWCRFEAESELQTVYIEEPLHCDVYRFAGTPDRIVIWNGVRWVLDIKTGQPMPHYPLQTAAYQHLDGEAFRRACVYINADGTYKVQEHKDLGDISVFLAALAMHNWRANNGVNND